MPAPSPATRFGRLLAVDWLSSSLRLCRLGSGRLLTHMTVLIFFAASTPARVVAAGVFLATNWLACTLPVATGMDGSHLPDLRCSHHLSVIDSMHDVVLNGSSQLVIHLVRLALEGDQWVLLTKRAQTNPFAEQI